MTIKSMKRAAVLAIITILCAGAVFLYQTADFKSVHQNAVLVMAHCKH